jgi:hypothetical protein
VSKLDKFKHVKELHSQNIESISITNEVLKVDKFNEISFGQPENKNFIVDTNDVLKLLKSIDVHKEQLKNI